MMFNSPHSRSVLCVILYTIALLTSPAHAEQISGIPELGEPANQVLSPSQEREIGDQFYQRVRNHPSFIIDAQINHYIQSLGDRLVNHNNLGNNLFTFFIFDNAAINAFAVPGGYIGFYRGLIDLAQNESQLASVVAHEIAHVTQRHLARLYAKQQGISLAATATIIAGIIASTQGNAQAGNAAIFSGIAAGQQSQINFTRNHELEADRIGIQLLANGEYDTTSMSAMFTALQRASLRGGNEGYEFLRTHPLSSRRVAEARSHAEKHNNRGKLLDSLDFQLIKARLTVLTHDNLPQLQRQYTQRLATTDNPAANNTDPHTLYALALIHQQLNTPRQAVPYINQLLDIAPQSIVVQLLQAGNLIALGGQNIGDLHKGLSLYAELQSNYPFHYPILEAYTQALTAGKHHDQAKVLLQEYLFNTPQPQAEAYKLLAFHQQQLGNLADSRINMADYFVKTGVPDAAFDQLKLALRNPGISPEQAQRVNAKLEEVKQIRLSRLQ